jgi:hypothetical protein
MRTAWQRKQNPQGRKEEDVVIAGEDPGMGVSKGSKDQE